jgi:ketosteroid isomerase-like protein
LAQGVVRGWDEISATAEQALRVRASADVVSIKWLSKGVALVDSAAETSEGRGWATEVWEKDRSGEYHIEVFRTRIGPSGPTFEGLSKLSPVTVSGDVSDEDSLRKNFKTFRAAYNSGDKAGVLSLVTEDCDAIVTFSFLGGRAQVLTGTAALDAKADSMIRTGTGKGSAFVAGEAKVIRFVSSDVAVVDGTAQITGIPAAHAFAPSEMSGVYTTYWRKSGSDWACAGARPWF